GTPPGGEAPGHRGAGARPRPVRAGRGRARPPLAGAGAGDRAGGHGGSPSRDPLQLESLVWPALPAPEVDVPGPGGRAFSVPRLRRPDGLDLDLRWGYPSPGDDQGNRARAAFPTPRTRDLPRSQPRWPDHPERRLGWERLVLGDGHRPTHRPASHPSGWG